MRFSLFLGKCICFKESFKLYKLFDSIKDSSNFEFPELPINYNQYITELRLHALDLADGKKVKADQLLGMKNGTIKQWLHQRKKR